MNTTSTQLDQVSTVLNTPSYRRKMVDILLPMHRFLFSADPSLKYESDLVPNTEANQPQITAMKLESFGRRVQALEKLEFTFYLRETPLLVRDEKTKRKEMSHTTDLMAVHGVDPRNPLHIASWMEGHYLDFFKLVEGRYQVEQGKMKKHEDDEESVDFAEQLLQ